MTGPQQGASLAELQQYVRRCEVERGFAEQSNLEKCLLLGEEVGELFKAVRRSVGLGIDPKSHTTDIGDGLADILNYLLAIANRADVDLEKAFWQKERLNCARRWT